MSYARVDFGLFGLEGVLSLADELGLTDDQVEAIRRLEREHRLKVADLEAKLKKLKAQWDYELSAEEPNFNRLKRLAEEMAQAEAKLKAERMKHELEVLKVLTPEQREKWRKLRRQPWLGIGKGIEELLEDLFEDLEEEFPGLRMRLRIFGEGERI